ncbi:carbohydrate ABC transporter permease [Paenibacillus cymbidii]|uniref:carbohydrate ABC transporter permease n=1 Tax=Paenibacillus cymbidii TaxID=1639034 RepID=UPI00108061F5|nr:carbohydrate ABC transporter permease [Paenibacillus cymbidii]
MNRSSRSPSSLAADIAIYAVLLLVCIVMIFPYVYVFAVSFTSAQSYVAGEFILFPRQWSLDAYRYILSTSAFLDSFRATAFIALAGTALSIVFTTSFAYAVTKKTMPGRNLLLLMLLVTMLFSGGLVPQYLLVEKLGLINSLWALILPVLTNAWSVFVVKSFFQSLPDSLEDSAQIDGCNDLVIWYRIIVPLSMPVIAAFSLFFAVGYWNTYFSGLIYMRDAAKWPLQVLLQQMILQNETNMGNMSVVSFDPSQAALPPETIKMAALVVVIAPIILVYPFLQKYFAKGVLLGSVKG